MSVYPIFSPDLKILLSFLTVRDFLTCQKR